MVEEYLKTFENRAVAYLNVDIAVIQTYNLVVSATPMLHRIIKEAAKRSPAPDPSLGYQNLWDHWTQRERPAAPDVIDYNLGSTSEHAPFYQRIGIPTSYMLWEINLVCPVLPFLSSFPPVAPRPPAGAVMRTATLATFFLSCHASLIFSTSRHCPETRVFLYLFFSSGLITPGNDGSP
ncbi:Glutamate carboxypeptidase 2 [Portunus trituberculatus]|uniref:Glutamate carboxypeptidase 2 n=1 Tax=Portunus trituberculatus TaxID=210409 RepID=A0A5B7HI42_PORTR|nr:Glutamate carboxypeptidase 2 [Portunus trituberculatus]